MGDAPPQKALENEIREEDLNDIRMVDKELKERHDIALKSRLLVLCECPLHLGMTVLPLFNPLSVGCRCSNSATRETLQSQYAQLRESVCEFLRSKQVRPFFLSEAPCTPQE